MTKLLRGVLAAMFVLCSAALAVAADRAIIVLDASGSMWGQIESKPKLQIARETLRSVLQTVPAELELGLMVYGHREKTSCSDIELVVAPQANSAGAIAAAADGLKFLGKTPLSAAVRQAAEALHYTEDKATVILITDGLETCNADPCALATELEQAGVDFTAHVVGFGLTAEEGRQVACLAENTGGKYLQASDAAALTEALAEAITPPPPPLVLPPLPPESTDIAGTPPAAPEPVLPPLPADSTDIAGTPPVAPEPVLPALPAESTDIAGTPPSVEPAKPEFNFVPAAVMVAGGEPLQDAGNAWAVYRANPDGSAGEHVLTDYGNYKGNLEPGDYVVRATFGEASIQQPVKVEEGKAYEPIFVLDAGTLIVRPIASAGEPVSDRATVITDYAGGSATNYGATKIVLPAGEVKLTVRLGAGEHSETLTLAAGQTIDKDVVLGVGRVVVNALYVAGGDKVDSAALSIKIEKARVKADGTRDQVTYAFGPDSKFDLPPGDYVAIAQMEQATVEQPFNIRAGEAKEVNVVLDAGVLAISAPGAKRIEVFAAKKDIQGNRAPFGYAFASSHQTTLPAGDYAIVVERDGNASKQEVSATVKAGERTEVTVP